MRLIFIILAVLSVFDGQSQTTDLRAKVIDGSTQKPIPYVNIGIVAESNGTVSDDQGYFEFQGVPLTASLTFSALGYETRSIVIEDLLDDKIVPLQPREYGLETVEVVASSLGDIETLGARNLRGRGLSLAFGSTMLGTELAAPIRVDREFYVESMHFVLNHAKGDSLLFRLNIYDFSDQVVGEKVLLENVYIREAQRKGVFTIDLSEKDLVLQDDVLVSLEWLRNFDELGNKNITFDSKKMKKPSGMYVRPTSNMEIRRMPTGRSTPCFYLVGRSVKEK